MVKIDFLFDFGSPNAYLAHRMIPHIEKRTGATFHYVPVLLGGVFKLTNNKAPMIAFGGIKNKLEYEQLEMKRFISRHELNKFQFNPNFPVNTLTVMRAAIAAGQAGCLMPYVEAVFAAMWEAGRKMDDADTIIGVLNSAGLNAQSLLAAAQTQSVKDALMKNTQDAVDRGAFGSPTIFVGDEMFFGKDRLRDVEDEIIRQAGAVR
ncbi:MAG TPA: 2-hydroxychromene-2-carboxylate isomerase [Rhizomicrobium sp.]|nr:2-hydroxychromene-2-carboxylate isomerase [Rhizomicrobium sp.]